MPNRAGENRPAFATIAVADRGPGALRLIRAVRESNAELPPGSPATETVALHGAADRDALFVRKADRSVEVSGLSPHPIDLESVERALESIRPSAVWTGWGPLAGGAEFADLCRRVGLRLVSEAPPAAPAPQAVRALSAEPGEGERSLLVAVLADGRGGVVVLGIRDATLVAGGGALLEESACPALSPDQEEVIRDAAASLCRQTPFSGAGTVQAAFVPKDGTMSLGPVRPGIGPGHTATEATTGIDLVKAELALAAGGPLPVSSAPFGHAVTALIRAEDPERGFAPAHGTVDLLRFGTGPGVRVDACVAEGERLSAGGDPSLAFVTAWGRDRPEALARLNRALSESSVVVRGGATNRTFLLGLLDRPEVASGDADATWTATLDSLDSLDGRRRHADAALLMVAIEVHDEEVARDRAGFLDSAARGRPRSSWGVGRTVVLRERGSAYRFRILQLGPGEYRAEVNGRTVSFRMERPGAFQRLLVHSRERVGAVLAPEDGGFLVETGQESYRIRRDDTEVVRAPAPAVVVAVPARPGDHAEAGDVLVVLEAMKMEMAVQAQAAGTVREVLARTGTQVDTGTPLVRLSPSASAEAEKEEEEGRGRISFEALADPVGTDKPDACRRQLGELRRLVLGFDVDPEHAKRLGHGWRTTCRGLTADDPDVFRGEEEILETFADVSALAVIPPGDDDGAEQAHASEEYFLTYLRSLDPEDGLLPATFLLGLARALRHFGVESLAHTTALEEGVYRIHRSLQQAGLQVGPIMSILDRRLEHVDALRPLLGPESRQVLDRLIASAERRNPGVADLARELRYRVFDQPVAERARDHVYSVMEGHLIELAADPTGADRASHVQALVECPQPLKGLLLSLLHGADGDVGEALLEALVRRYYRIRPIENVRTATVQGRPVARVEYEHEDTRVNLAAVFAVSEDLETAARSLVPLLAEAPDGEDVIVDFYLWRDGRWGDGGDQADAWPGDPDRTSARIAGVLNGVPFPRQLRRIVVAMGGSGSALDSAATAHFTFRPGNGGYAEEKLYRGLHPMMGKRLQLWRLSNFHIERLPSVEDVYLFRGVGRDNPKDERLFALAEVRDLTPVRDDRGRVVQLPHLERMLTEAYEAIRVHQSHRPAGRRLQWNRVVLSVRPPVELTPLELFGIVQRLVPQAGGLGLEKVVVVARVRDPETGRLRDSVMHVATPVGQGLSLRITDPAPEPIDPLTEYQQKVVGARQRGLTYPYELIRMLTPSDRGPAGDFPPGTFVEHDLDQDGQLVPVDRPHGQNKANLVVGLITNRTAAYPEGMTRVALLGDPTRALGALAEPECRRIVEALNLAERLGVPLEWFALSAGAKISMDSGTENMDWIGRVLRRLIEFTQAGGEINVVVAGINVGAQPYWNAEATMLMHTRGILVMTPESAMVLTGKQALDYSGGVSAADNFGIGGHDRVMGPNGQAQYWSRDLHHACRILFRHYDHTYVAPGERFPRRVPTTDPAVRDVRSFELPDAAAGFLSIGEVFSDLANPGRKKPFDMRSVMRAVSDQDHPPLERWGGMRDAEIAVVWDAHLGGIPVSLLGIESRPLPRYGTPAADGPEHWTAGTLFPMSSKKIARAINAASGNRPVVVLANLSGFDGSPESLRNLQLEYGAEIGRAVVNFRGPMVFCVVSRYHGGAFVVFSAALNEHMEIAALEGSYASVIGGAPAAAVVFSRDVDARTDADPRVQEAKERVASASESDAAALRARLAAVTEAVRTEKLGQVADEFDHVHTIQRAQQVGSVHRIIPVEALRPYLIDAVERGIRRELEGS
jgi:acetyl/propionyl-CoA carboxylase alpha subunit/acetyl-CoA carboxylase carboxyltransferase component